MNLEKLIQIAKIEAKKSTYRIKVGAVIFNSKGIVVSKAYNIPFGWKKHLHPKFCKFKTSLHAEVLAIINAKRNLEKCSLLVIRINSKDELRMTKPCEYCMKYIEYTGLKDIWYSNEEGEIVQMLR